MEHRLIEQICKSLRGTTQDLKYGSEYCFLISEKLFCVKSLQSPHHVSFKANASEQSILIQRGGIVAGHKSNWVKVKDINALSEREWEYYLRQSYEIVSHN